MDGYDVFINFCKLHNLGSISLDPKRNVNEYCFTVNDLRYMKMFNMIYEGDPGGLVLGPLHSEGGVQVLRSFDNETFFYQFEIEGWEYVTCSYLDDNEMEEVWEINELHRDYDKELILEFDIPSDCKIIDTRQSKTPVLLLDDYRRIIVNRMSTKTYIKRIIDIDNRYNI